MSYKNLEEAIQDIISLEAQNTSLINENKALQLALESSKMFFRDKGWSDEQKLLPYAIAKTGFDGYCSTSPLRSSDDPTKLLKGFSVSLDKMPKLTERSDLKGYFLMFAKTPDAQPQPLPNTFPFKNEYTVMVLGLDENHNLLLDNANRLPIVYEYMTPCPNTCPVNLSTYF